MTCLLIYLALINAFAFAAMGIDKAKARRRARRIPEVTLLLLAAVGGSVGAILGMLLFRHKTRRAAFFIGLPVILILQGVLLSVAHFFAFFRQ